MDRGKKTKLIGAIGLLVTSSSLLIREYIPFRYDFVAGVVEGIGIGMLIVSLYRLRKLA